MPRSELEEIYSDKTSHFKVTIEINARGGSNTTCHTEEFKDLGFLQVHEHLAIGILDCVSAVFGEYGEAEAKLVFGHLKNHPLVKKSVVVGQGEEVPEGAMLVGWTGEVLNDESGMY